MKLTRWELVLLALTGLALAYVVFGDPALAGSDRHRSAREVQCQRQAIGAQYRRDGHADKVVWMARADMIGEEPKDAIHLEYEQETPEQKASFEAALLLGWHAQDDWIAAHNGTARDPADLYAACLAGEDA